MNESGGKLRFDILKMRREKQRINQREGSKFWLSPTKTLSLHDRSVESKSINRGEELRVIVEAVLESHQLITRSPHRTPSDEEETIFSQKKTHADWWSFKRQKSPASATTAKPKRRKWFSFIWRRKNAHLLYDRSEVKRTRRRWKKVERIRKHENFFEEQKNLVIDDVRMKQAKARWAQQLDKRSVLLHT